MSLSVQKVREQDATVDFKATLTPGAYELELNDWFSKKSKNLRVDGFRPGKVPLTIVKSKYLSDATNSIINTLVDKAIKEIGKEHKIRIAGQPKITIEKADSTAGFECMLVVECLPTIELQDFSKITCEELVVEVSNSDVDDYMKNLLEKHQGFEKEPKKGKAELGDKVKVVVKESAQATNVNSQELVLAKDVEDVALQKILKSIAGRSAGDEFEVELPNTKDVKEVKIFIVLELVYSPKKFKLDDEFAKEFDCENLDALRKKVHEVNKNDQNKLVSLFHKRQILDGLNSKYNFALPKSAVDFEFGQIWQRLQDEIANSKKRGEYEDDVNLGEVEAEYRSIAERRVKLGLLVSEIAKVHKIELTNEDLQKAIVAEAMKQPEHAKAIYEYYAKNSDALQSLSAPIIEDKVVDFVFAKATKKQTKITSKELPSKLKGVLPGYEGEDNSKPGKASKKSSKESGSEGETAPAKKATKTKGE